MKNKKVINIKKQLATKLLRVDARLRSRAQARYDRIKASLPNIEWHRDDELAKARAVLNRYLLGESCLSRAGWYLVREKQPAVNKEEAAFNRAVEILSRYHVGAGGDMRYSEARAYLESLGHTVTTRSRPGVMGDNPSSMVYIDGYQVR